MRARARDAIAGSRVVPPAAAAPLGWHLEGPFLAERRRGAHPSEWLESITDDNASAFDAGWVRMITLAPELPGALALIRALCTRGITVSIGHTDATHGEMRAAIEAGARLITHLFNAMAPFHHREPGPIGVALTDPRVSSSLIVDDIHVHQAAVQLAWQALAPQRLVLVSDSVGAASTADGVVRLGDGTLAGSRIGLLDAVRNLTRITGCGPDAAIACATAAPARVLGLRDRGHLDPGAVADVILLTPELDLAGVIVRGNVLLAP
jgi:N-acetylglucosamine-6-phosphate deacetylase